MLEAHGLPTIPKRGAEATLVKVMAKHSVKMRLQSSPAACFSRYSGLLS